MRLLHDTHRVSALATQQKGLIRLDQLYALEFSRAAARNLTENRLLHPVHSDVFAVGHLALSQSAEYLAAAWALGPAGVIAHHSAAAHLALTQAGGVIHVAVPSYSGYAHRDNIQVHRQRLRTYEVVEHDGVPCTSVCRTVMDVAASAPRILESVFEEAQVRYRLQPAFLASEVVLRPNHRGTAELRRLLTGAVDPGQVQSLLELKFLQLCAAFGLPRPLTQVRFGRYRADFWFKDHDVVVETDGRRWHATWAKKGRDKRKDEYLAAQGQRVLHARWGNVVDQPASVAPRVHQALASSVANRS